MFQLSYLFQSNFHGCIQTVQGFPTFERFQGGLVLVSHDARLIQATGQRLVFSTREAQVVSRLLFCITWNANGLLCDFWWPFSSLLWIVWKCDDFHECLYHLYRITLYIHSKSFSLLFAKKLDLLDMILAYSTSETMVVWGDLDKFLHETNLYIFFTYIYICIAYIF